jgi:hypothetical protein
VHQLRSMSMNADGHGCATAFAVAFAGLHSADHEAQQRVHNPDESNFRVSQRGEPDSEHVQTIDGATSQLPHAQSGVCITALEPSALGPTAVSDVTTIATAIAPESQPMSVAVPCNDGSVCEKIASRRPNVLGTSSVNVIPRAGNNANELACLLDKWSTADPNLPGTHGMDYAGGNVRVSKLEAGSNLNTGINVMLKNTFLNLRDALVEGGVGFPSDAYWQDDRAPGAETLATHLAVHTNAPNELENLLQDFICAMLLCESILLQQLPGQLSHADSYKVTLTAARRAMQDCIKACSSPHAALEEIRAVIYHLVWVCILWCLCRGNMMC